MAQVIEEEEMEALNKLITADSNGSVVDDFDVDYFNVENSDYEE